MKISDRPHLTLYIMPLIIAVLLGMYVWKNIKTQEIIPALPASGKPLPSFNLPSLTNPAARFTQQNLRGKVSLLNIWASWCTACQNEHVVLMQIKNQYHEIIYGINYRDNIENAKNWLAAKGDPYKMSGVDSNGAVAKNLGIYGTPETFLIDQQGMIRYVHIGTLDMDIWKNEFLPLIKNLTEENNG